MFRLAVRGQILPQSAILIDGIGQRQGPDPVGLLIIEIDIARIAAGLHLFFPQGDAPVYGAVGKRSHAHLIDIRFPGCQKKNDGRHQVDQDHEKNDQTYIQIGKAFPPGTLHRIV